MLESADELLSEKFVKHLLQRLVDILWERVNCILVSLANFNQRSAIADPDCLEEAFSLFRCEGIEVSANGLLTGLQRSVLSQNGGSSLSSRHRRDIPLPSKLIGKPTEYAPKKADSCGSSTVHMKAPIGTIGNDAPFNP